MLETQLGDTTWRQRCLRTPCCSSFQLLSLSSSSSRKVSKPFYVSSPRYHLTAAILHNLSKNHLVEPSQPPEPWKITIKWLLFWHWIWNDLICKNKIIGKNYYFLVNIPRELENLGILHMPIKSSLLIMLFRLFVIIFTYYVFIWKFIWY